MFWSKKADCRLVSRTNEGAKGPLLILSDRIKRIYRILFIKNALKDSIHLFNILIIWLITSTFSALLCDLCAFVLKILFPTGRATLCCGLKKEKNFSRRDTEARRKEKYILLLKPFPILANFCSNPLLNHEKHETTRNEERTSQKERKAYEIYFF